MDLLDSRNMDVIVRPVTTSRQRNQFIRYPYQLNAKWPNWVPPLLVSQKETLNEQLRFWRENKHQFFLAYTGDQIVGRIAAFTNTDHAAHFGTKDGFFGFLEAIDSEEVFKKLLKETEAFLSAQGCTKIIGPINPTIHHELGVLTEGFEQPPYFMLTYNQTYYDRNIQRAGYQKLKDFGAYKLNTDEFQFTEKIARVQELLKKRYSLTIRTPRMHDFVNELKVIHEIYNDAFVNHWGFSPISWDDFQFLGKDMKMLLDKEMVLIAEIQGKPIGFLLAIPNLNEVLVKIRNGKLFPFGLIKLLYLKRNIKSLRVITIAIKKEYQHLGIGGILYPEIALRAKQRGYKQAELSWVVEDNIQMNKICRDVGGVVTKTYRLYENK